MTVCCCCWLLLLLLLLRENDRTHRVDVGSSRARERHCAGTRPGPPAGGSGGVVSRALVLRRRKVRGPCSRRRALAQVRIIEGEGGGVRVEVVPVGVCRLCF